MSKKKKQFMGILLAFILLLAAASYTVFAAPLSEKETAEYTEETVTRGDLKVGVTESGYLEYEEHSITYDLDLSVIEEEEEEDEEAVKKYLTIEEVYAAAGKTVTKGEALLRFSQESVSQVRKLLENALLDAKVDYNEAESEYRLAALEAQNTQKIQNTAAKYASEIYQSASSAIEDEINALKIQIIRYTEKIPELEEAVAEAGEDYKEAKEEYERIKPDYDKTGTDHISNYLIIQGNYATAKNTFERAEAALEQAGKRAEENATQIEKLKAESEMLQAQKKIQVLAVKQEYEETLINGENAKYIYDSAMESLEEALKEAEEEKNALEEKLEAFEELVGEDGILYAPESGKITRVTYEAGDTLERTGILFSYIMEEDMTISVDVTQEDVVSLTVGDTVDVVFTAYEGETYRGMIYSIDTTATSADTPTISYAVVIKVEGTLDRIYGGMSANITFITDSRENTLYISRKALVEENDRTYVYVRSGLQEKEKREVETGIRNETNVEIVSGLTEEDTIYIVSYRDAE